MTDAINTQYIHIYNIVYIHIIHTHTQHIYFLVGGHLSCFWFSVLVKKGAMNLFCDYKHLSPLTYLGAEWLHHRVGTFSFSRNCQTVSQVVPPWDTLLLVTF